MSPIKLTEQLLKAFDTKQEAKEYSKKQKAFDKIANKPFEYEIRPEIYSEKETLIQGKRMVYRVIKITEEII